MTGPPTDPVNEIVYSTDDLDRVLVLPTLTYLPDGDEVTVGRPGLDLYAVLPADGAALLQRLADGSGVRAAADWYAETFGEPVDIEDFVRALDDLGFLGADPAEQTSSPVRFRRLGEIVFGPAAWCLYAALLITAAVFLLQRPGLRPSYRQLFFSPSVMVIEFTLFLGQVPGVALHESFHALAGRRLGLRSRLRVGHRLYYLVVETAMDGLTGVPRGRRYLPILAGMLADGLWFSLLTLTAAATSGPAGPVGAVAGACLALAFATLLRFVWQFQFYLRTDLYALVQTTLGLNDLHGAGWFRLRRAGNRIRAAFSGRPAPPADASGWSERELWHAGWYGPLMVAGYAVSALSLVLVVVPTMVKGVGMVAGRLVPPHHAGVGGLADSSAFLAMNLAQLVLVVELSRRARTARATVPPPNLT
jgi:hypothetical protein